LLFLGVECRGAGRVLGMSHLNLSISQKMNNGVFIRF
jgi:hypothetical protein